jgi:hypothetical protein
VQGTEGLRDAGGGSVAPMTGQGTAVLQTEPLARWADLMLRHMLFEQQRVRAMTVSDLAAYTLDSKEKMPVRKAFSNDHKNADNHKKLRAHLQEVVEDLLAFNKMADKMEAKAMRAVASTFSEDALVVWTGCAEEARHMTTSSGSGQPSILFRALAAVLVILHQPEHSLPDGGQLSCHGVGSTGQLLGQGFG